MTRGEIRWYKIAAPDKRRPVRILARDSVLECLGEVTVRGSDHKFFSSASVVI